MRNETKTIVHVLHIQYVTFVVRATSHCLFGSVGPGPSHHCALMDDGCARFDRFFHLHFALPLLSNALCVYTVSYFLLHATHISRSYGNAHKSIIVQTSTKQKERKNDFHWTASKKSNEIEWNKQREANTYDVQRNVICLKIKAIFMARHRLSRYRTIRLSLYTVGTSAG